MGVLIIVLKIPKERQTESTQTEGAKAHSKSEETESSRQEWRYVRKGLSLPGYGGGEAGKDLTKCVKKSGSGRSTISASGGHPLGKKHSYDFYTTTGEGPIAATQKKAVNSKEEWWFCCAGGSKRGGALVSHSPQRPKSFAYYGWEKSPSRGGERGGYKIEQLLGSSRNHIVHEERT